MRDIAVAVACYNNEAEVIEFASNLSRQSIINNIQLLVTCNAVQNFERVQEEIRRTLPSACVFNPGKNLGYLPGCLYGVEKSGVPYSWVMISNTDIEFRQYDFFEKAVKDVREDIWCIGPDIELKATGVHQNPFLKERPTKLKVATWRIAYSCYPLFWFYFKLYDIKPKKIVDEELQSEDVYAVHGSCFLLRKECLQKVREEKHGIFMYGEELWVAEIVRENGKKCRFNNEVGIFHNENQVTGKIGGKRKQQWFKQSINYMVKRFYS